MAFQLASSPIIESEWRVPHLANANGGDLYLYPAFALYFASAERFALIEHKDITLAFRPRRFIEEEDVPSDAAVVDQTWAKANKDGSPDRRLANNFAIPVAAYGMLDLMSASGLNGEYMVSNLEATQRFARTWAQFIAATAAA